MSVGILGSGFGLYGYLPALVTLGESVILPERYRPRLQGRADVASLEDAIAWVADDEAVLARADALIVSQRPADQVARVRQALEGSRVGRFLLEKPLAPEPEGALALVDAVTADGRTLRVGFTFRYTAWGRALAEWLGDAQADDTLRIDWRFRAHHYAHDIETWKRRPDQGGGALRFYGIHLVAFLAEQGYRDVVSSRIRGRDADDAEGWEAVLTAPGRPACRIVVDSNAAAPALFRVSATGARPLLRELRDPFDEVPLHGGFDRRVELLSQLCRSFLRDEVPVQPWCRASVVLWQAIEARTSRETAQAPAPPLSA